MNDTKLKTPEEEVNESSNPKPPTNDKRQQALLLEALQDAEINENDYAFDNGSAYRKRIAIANLLGVANQKVYQFTRDIGYRNFNEITDMDEFREVYELWDKHTRRKRKNNIISRIF